jgi:hypothetical protein
MEMAGIGRSRPLRTAETRPTTCLRRSRQPMRRSVRRFTSCGARGTRKLVRRRLPAGGRWIRTIGSCRKRSPVYVAEGELRGDRTGHQRNLRGTDSSNPSPSSKESSRAYARGCGGTPSTCSPSSSRLWTWQFRSLAEPWADTGTSTGRLMIAVLGGLADVERDLIRTRTAEGRSRAQKRGQHMGRPPKLTEAQQAEARRRRAEGATLAELARSYGVGKSTISRLTT